MEQRYRIYCYGTGFVVIAHDRDVERKRDEFGVDFFSVAKSATIRRWETTRGLAERAVHGPGKATLDSNPCRLSIPLLALHHTLEVLPTQDAAWAKALGKAELEALK